MFNILKLHFRKQNVYTMDQMMHVLNRHDQVHDTPAKPSDFYDMDTYLDQLYRRFTPGTVHKAHIFSADVDNGTNMKINVSKWELEDEPEMEQDMIKSARYTNFGELTRQQASMVDWIHDIKRCKLFKKYGLSLHNHFETQCAQSHPKQFQMDKSKSGQ